MKYVALGEEEMGGGKQKEGRGPWHFLSNDSCIFFFLGNSFCRLVPGSRTGSLA